MPGATRQCLVPQCLLLGCTCQALTRFVAKHGAAAKFNPATLPQLQSRKPCAGHFNVNTLFSIQMTGYAKNRTTRLYLRTSGRGGGGLVNIVGARLAGELPLLELRCQFHTTPASQEFAAAEAALRPPGAAGCMAANVQPGELNLAAALLQANTGCQCSTVCCWGRRRCEQRHQGFRQTQVCGADGAKSCSRCKGVAYCSKECQLQVPFNQPLKQMKKATKKGRQWRDGNAPAVQRPADAGKKFIVKVQAPMSGPPGMPLLLPGWRTLHSSRALVVETVSVPGTSPRVLGRIALRPPGVGLRRPHIVSRPPGGHSCRPCSDVFVGFRLHKLKNSASNAAYLLLLRGKRACAYCRASIQAIGGTGVDAAGLQQWCPDQGHAMVRQHEAL
ncbi:hypothetical protein COO60DRAFT_1459165 [Scenedesmus sp. NREL 46B-D3]|nr:hypothetical protein COO60DRAFT_1459165 [Scenedesmus sp. NREL 46B-D3]